MTYRTLADLLVLITARVMVLGDMLALATT